MKPIGFDGYWGSAEPAQSSRTSASASLATVFMVLPRDAGMMADRAD